MAYLSVNRLSPHTKEPEMTITYERSYYGKRDATAVPPAALIARAEETQSLLHPERTHEWAVTEPNLTWAPQLRGPIGWIVTFRPTR